MNIIKAFSQLTAALENQMFVLYDPYMGVSKYRGTPKWMVYTEKPY